MSDEISSSSSPPPVEQVLREAPEKKKKKHKVCKSKSHITEADEARDERDEDPEWALSVSKDWVPITDEGASDFDWDAIAEDDDLELWAIRIPHGMKTKHFEGLTIKLPDPDDKGDNDDDEPASLGTFKRGKEKYEVRDVTGRGTSELAGARVLLQRKESGGNYMFAPREISRHLTVTQSMVVPTMAKVTSATVNPTIPIPKPKRPQPTNKLKHRFVPLGAINLPDASPEEDQEMEQAEPEVARRLGVAIQDVEMLDPDQPKPKTKKKKKDGVDADTPGGGSKGVTAWAVEVKAEKKRKHIGEGHEKPKKKKIKREEA